MRQTREIRDLIRRLKEKCEIIAETLRFRRLATDAELESYLPGGWENQETNDLEAWIFTRAQYTRLCERIGLADEKRDSALSGGEDEVIKALSDATEQVTLSSGESVTVHPKSFVALLTIERIDHRIGWLAEKRAQLIERNQYADVQLLERSVNEIAFLYGLIVWAATHEGVGLPFGDHDEVRELPANVQALSPTDYSVIRAGSLRVNAMRLYVLLTMLSAKTPPDPASRQSWATFFSLREEDSHTPARTLMRDRSLSSQLAASLLAADAHEAMRERAEAESKADKAVA